MAGFHKEELFKTGTLFVRVGDDILQMKRR